MGSSSARALPLVCTLSLALCACATSPDPHQGGFISGIVGLAGGGYQRRVDERQQTYQGEVDAGTRLKAQARELEQERAAVRADLNRANARLADLERRIAAQRAALRAQGAAANRAEARRLDQAQAQLVRTKGELRGIRPQDQSVADLKARSQALDRDLNAIDGMVATVGGKGF
jgi:septal ring factor EnvC (AmiA/AmiB activator)